MKIALSFPELSCNGSPNRTLEYMYSKEKVKEVPISVTACRVCTETVPANIISTFQSSCVDKDSH